MITIYQIKGGRDYVSRHLRANDYYSEGQSVIGFWRGNAARILGIEGQTVTDDVIEALRKNLHPETGERLRPRSSKVVFHDVVVSAPKAVSIAAIVGGDERLRSAHQEAAAKALERMEKYVQARDRAGTKYNTETTIKTGNGAYAVFQHDTSRELDAQLHTHNLFSNHTWCAEKQEWRALQPKEMMEQVPKWIRRAYYRDMAKASEGLGYEVEWRKMGFGLKGISKESEDLLSTRTMQKRGFIERYKSVFGEMPSKKRVEYFVKEGKGAAHSRFRDEFQVRFGKAPSEVLQESFVKDWRSKKMKHSSPKEVFLRNCRILEKAGRLDEVERTVLKAQTLYQKREHKEGQSLRADISPSNVSPVKIARKKTQKVQKNLPAIERMEAIRRIKRGMLVVRALQGHPALLLAAQFTQSARERNQHATRRT